MGFDPPPANAPDFRPEDAPRVLSQAIPPGTETGQSGPTRSDSGEDRTGQHFGRRIEGATDVRRQDWHLLHRSRRKRRTIPVPGGSKPLAMEKLGPSQPGSLRSTKSRTT